VPHIGYGAEIRGIHRSASRSVGKSGRCASEPVIERWRCFKKTRSSGIGSVATTNTSGFFRSSSHIANPMILPRVIRTLDDFGLPFPVICTPKDMLEEYGDDPTK